MANTPEKSFRTEKFLSASIFVLWSLGVVVIPMLRSVLTEDAILSIWVLYILLQVVLLAFALYLLGALTSRTIHMRRLRSGTLWRAALYIYVVAMLVASIGLSCRMLLIA